MKENDVIDVFSELAHLDRHKEDYKIEYLYLTVHTYYDGSYSSSYENSCNIPEEHIVQILHYSEYKQFHYSDIKSIDIDF